MSQTVCAASVCMIALVAELPFTIPALVCTLPVEYAVTTLTTSGVVIGD